MLTVENVATPFTAATVLVPDNVPPPGFEPIATVTSPVNAVATFPWASSAVTAIAGVIAAPAVVPVGCTVTTSWVAAPGVMSNAVLVAAVRAVAVAVSVYPVPALSMLRFENVATPATAATVAVPPSVPPPAFVPITTVTSPVKSVAVFPCASRAVTCTGGEIADPAVVLVGATVKASCVAGPGVTVTVVVCVIAVPLIVAETVFGPTAFELKVPVATPLASVAPAGWVSVFPLPVAARTTVAPPIGLPAASCAVTVMVLVAEPAAIEPGAAVTVDWVAETLPAVILKTLLGPPVSPLALAVRV